MVAWNHVGSAAGTVLRAVNTAQSHVRTGAHGVRARVEQQVSESQWPPKLQGALGRWNHIPSVMEESRNIPRGSLPPLEVRVCSWNMHGSQLHPSDDLMQWLAPGGAAADIYAICVQELVDLGPRSFVMSASGDEHRQAALEAAIAQVLQRSGMSFARVCGFGMMGLALIIFIREELRPYFHGLDCDRVKTGLDGVGGNKGCVCARFALGDITFCFVNVHLASGQHASAERNQHLGQILSDAFQATSRNRGSTRPSKQGFHRSGAYHIARHHLAVITGDFNSRLDLPKEEAWPPGPQHSWVERDQILLGHLSNLRGFREGVVSFKPTYKYVPGTGELASNRCPAWCDRVVYQAEYGLVLEMLEYDSFPAMYNTSDHHPVAAHFEVVLPEMAAHGADPPQTGANHSVQSQHTEAQPKPRTNLPGAVPSPCHSTQAARAAAVTPAFFPPEMNITPEHPVKFVGSAYSSSTPSVILKPV